MVGACPAALGARVEEGSMFGCEPRASGGWTWAGSGRLAMEGHFCPQGIQMRLFPGHTGRGSPAHCGQVCGVEAMWWLWSRWGPERC